MPEQHILWLDVAVDDLFIVSVLQSGGHLLDMRQNNFRREHDTRAITLAQGAIGSVIHDQEWSVALYTEFQYLYDIGMSQASDSARLCEKVPHVVVGQSHI